MEDYLLQQDAVALKYVQMPNHSLVIKRKGEDWKFYAQIQEFFRGEWVGKKLLQSGDAIRVPLPKNIVVMKCKICLEFT